MRPSGLRSARLFAGECVAGEHTPKDLVGPRLPRSLPRARRSSRPRTPPLDCPAVSTALRSLSRCQQWTVSRVLFRRALPLAGEDHSSRRRVAAPLEHSHPGTGTLDPRSPHEECAGGKSASDGSPSTAPLFELAPGRACLAAGHPAVARGLLPHDFTLTCARLGRQPEASFEPEPPSAV